LAKSCKIYEEINGQFNSNTKLEGILLGNDKIKELFKDKGSSLNKQKQFFKKYKRNKIYVLLLAPFRTSSDLEIIISKNIENNLISFETEYNISDMAAAVLNQRFYLGIFSDDCLLRFKNIPLLNIKKQEK